MKAWDRKSGKKDPRWKRIVALRDKGFTLQQIGDMFDLTRERIRQLEFLARNAR